MGKIPASLLGPVGEAHDVGQWGIGIMRMMFLGRGTVPTLG
jgi:hypothetical protein